MNRNRLEQWILLDQSGELGVGRRWLLRREMARNPEARRLAAGFGAIQDLARQAPCPAVGDGVVRTVLAAAREHAADDRSASPVRTLAWRPAFAVAAILLLSAAGVVLSLRGSRGPALAGTSGGTTATQLAWDDQLDNSFESLRGSVTVAAAAWDGTTSSADTEALAKQLLELEGEKI